MPIFAGGLDFSGPLDSFYYNPMTRKPLVDAVVSLTGFALVGGPAKQDSPKVCMVHTTLAFIKRGLSMALTKAGSVDVRRSCQPGAAVTASPSAVVEAVEYQYLELLN